MCEDYRQGFHDVRDSFDMAYQLFGYFSRKTMAFHGFSMCEFTPGYFLNSVRSKIAMSADLGKPQIAPDLPKPLGGRRRKRAKNM